MIGSTGALYFMEKDKIKELEQEIETHIKLNKQLLEDIDRAGKEIERLNNIINELEEYLNKVIETSTEQEKITCSFVLQYLQKLKGSDK